MIQGPARHKTLAVNSIQSSGNETSFNSCFVRYVTSVLSHCVLHAYFLYTFYFISLSSLKHQVILLALFTSHIILIYTDLLEAYLSRATCRCDIWMPLHLTGVYT